MTYEEAIKKQCRADRKFQDAKEAEMKLAHEILHSEDIPKDEKYIRLITECGYGTERAQQLVYGKVVFKRKYENKALDTNPERFYKK